MILALAIYVLAGCKKDEVIGGGTANPRVNMTTYDFLKNHSWHFFDTTILVIDKAGMKDIINGDVTFFAPTDFSINRFIANKRDEARKKDERLNFTLDSLFKYYTPQMLRDSLGMYVIKGKVNREQMTLDGKLYETLTPGQPMLVSLLETTDYLVDNIITSKAQYVTYTKIIGERDVNGKDPSGSDKLQDIRVKCQTSGILTTNGVLHVLENTHIWTFRR